MVGFVLFGFKGEDGFEFRGRSAVVEESVHSSLPFKRQEREESQCEEERSIGMKEGDALRVPVRFYYLLKIARPGA